MRKAVRLALGFVLAFVAGMATASLAPARAEQAAIDRSLVERLVRAAELQARQLEALVRGTERCSKN
jgi:hypothetical protein